MFKDLQKSPHCSASYTWLSYLLYLLMLWIAFCDINSNKFTIDHHILYMWNFFSNFHPWSYFKLNNAIIRCFFPAKCVQHISCMRKRRRYMAEILPIRRKILHNQSINIRKIQFTCIKLHVLCIAKTGYMSLDLLLSPFTRKTLRINIELTIDYTLTQLRLLWCRYHQYTCILECRQFQ